MFSYFHWFYYQGVHSQVCTLVNMNLSSIVASLIRIQKVCYNLNSRCQANTFFDDDIFWEISIKCDIFTNKCLLGIYDCHPPPIYKTQVYNLLTSWVDATNGEISTS